jgi:hypothetical protein
MGHELFESLCEFIMLISGQLLVAHEYDEVVEPSLVNVVECRVVEWFGQIYSVNLCAQRA